MAVRGLIRIFALFLTAKNTGLYPHLSDGQENTVLCCLLRERNEWDKEEYKLKR